MRGDLLDVVLLLLAAVFAFSGYRQGFVVGALSFVGFVGGGVLGAQLAPRVVDEGRERGADTTLLALAIVLALALLGQLALSVVGGLLRRRLTWTPVRRVDAVGGAALSVVSLLLVAWLVGSAVASSSYPAVASQVRRSVVITTVDALVPDRARASVEGFRDLVDDRGFPDVFGSLDPTDAATTDPPDAALAQSEVVTRLADEVLKVTGVAASCSRRLEGTAFQYAPDRLMTNAHVLAGVDAPQVELPDGRQLDGEVVLFDPAKDLAVLAVEGLPGDPLAFAPAAPPGTSAVVLGYPQDGPYRADAARVREVVDARGPDIYDRGEVVREVYALRGRVRPGNSGGPVVDASGAVLGVVFAAAADDADTGYALTAAEVAPEAQAGLTAEDAVDTGPCD